MAEQVEPTESKPEEGKQVVYTDYESFKPPIRWEQGFWTVAAATVLASVTAVAVRAREPLAQAFGVALDAISATPEAMKDTYHFVDRNQFILGSIAVILGARANFNEYKNNRRLTRAGLALAIAGGSLAMADVRYASHSDPSATTIVEEPPTPEPVVVNGNTVVITIPAELGLPCLDTPPQDVASGDNTYNIIKSDQRYSPEQMDVLYNGAPDIAALNDLGLDDRFDVGCAA